MTERNIVSCPLGSACPDSGRHIAGSEILHLHTQRAQQGGQRSGGTTGSGQSRKKDKKSQEQYQKEKERQRREANPLNDLYGEEEKDTVLKTASDNSIEYALAGAAVWAAMIAEADKNKEINKVSVIEDVTMDEERDEFAVTFKTGDRILFEKDENNPGYFVATKYDPEGNSIGSHHVEADSVMEYISGEDKNERFDYAKRLAAAGTATYAGTKAARWWQQKRREGLKTNEMSDNSSMISPVVDFFRKWMRMAFPFIK